MGENPELSDMFPLPDEAKKLQIFVGDWKVEGTITLEGIPRNLKGTWKFDSAAAGWGVLARMKMEIEGMGTYEEVDIAGFDPGQGLVHVFTVTNTAAVHDHRGAWSDENTLNLSYGGQQEGRNYKEQITVKFHSQKEFSIHEVDTIDGQIISTMNVTLRK